MASDPSIRVSRLPRIGRYQPVSRIATGGMGAVYKALDTENDREVALKVLSPEWATKPVLLRRFELEALHGNQLAHHANVVQFYEAGEAGGIHYLALEFVDGIDLKEYVTNKDRVDVAEALNIILQAARAIAHLHNFGITHRDIKPSNFLIFQQDGKPVVKLIDLGLARNTEDDEECRVTRPGTTLGTVDYIAPEQARNSGAADVRSDIYALGCTWFHLLAGRPPFPEGSVTERILQHVETTAPDIRELNPDVPEAMAEVLARMLAKQPADRYQTPAVLIRELEGLRTPRATAVAANVLAGLASGQKDAFTRVRRPVTRRKQTGSSEQLRVFQDDEPANPVASKTRVRKRRRWGFLLWPAIVCGTCLAIGIVVASGRDRPSNTPLEIESTPAQPAKNLSPPPAAAPGVNPTDVTRQAKPLPKTEAESNTSQPPLRAPIERLIARRPA